MEIEKKEKMRLLKKIEIVLWITIFLAFIINFGYTYQYSLPKTGLMFAPYGYIPITITNIIILVTVIPLLIIWIKNGNRNK